MNHTDIHYMFEDCLNMGAIKRIDFAPVHPGSRIVVSLEECQTKSVFIHFHGLNLHEYLNEMYDLILGVNPQPYKLWLNKWFPQSYLNGFTNKIKYFMIMRAKSPVPDTYMNIHQIADALKKQEMLNQRLVQFIAKHLCGNDKEMMVELGEIANTPLTEFETSVEL